MLVNVPALLRSSVVVPLLTMVAPRPFDTLAKTLVPVRVVVPPLVVSADVPPMPLIEPPVEAMVPPVSEPFWIVPPESVVEEIVLATPPRSSAPADPTVTAVEFPRAPSAVAFTVPVVTTRVPKVLATFRDRVPVPVLVRVPVPSTELSNPRLFPFVFT